MIPQYSTVLKLVVITVCYFIIGGCTSLEPTKPNEPYPGPYPSEFKELANKNPLLAQELGKLPEIKDGISELEATALDNLGEIYNNNSKIFNKAFEELYQVGLPEVRKYCTPLQALYWLAEDSKIEELHAQINNYSLSNLLSSSWNFNSRFELEALDMSEQEAEEIVDAVSKDVIWYVKYQKTAKDTLKMCYSRNPDDIPLEYRKKIENDNGYKIDKLIFDRNKLRWKDLQKVIDRLNSPELLDFYIDQNIFYAHYISSYHRSFISVIKEKYGDCDDLAYLGKIFLQKAGYKVFGRIVGDDGIKSYHIGLGIRLEDGSYLLAVDFRGDGKNHMSGPYKTLLELDEVLGFGGYGRKQRGLFHFDWNGHF